MTKKRFLIYRIITVIILGAVTGASVSYGNWYLPMLCIMGAWVFLYGLRSRVKEVLADERDYGIAGRAALSAMRIYSMIAVIAGLVLYIAQRENEVLFGIGSTLMYSAFFLMLLYTILFKIYAKKDGRN